MRSASPRVEELLTDKASSNCLPRGGTGEAVAVGDGVGVAVGDGVGVAVGDGVGVAVADGVGVAVGGRSGRGGGGRRRQGTGRFHLYNAGSRPVASVPEIESGADSAHDGAEGDRPSPSFSLLSSKVASGHYSLGGRIRNCHSERSASGGRDLRPAIEGGLFLNGPACVQRP